MPKATPPTSWASTSAGFTARPTSAPTTTRRSAMRAGLGIDVEHDRARAARVGHLRHLERGAGGQAPLGGQLGQRDAAAAGPSAPRGVGHLGLRPRPRARRRAARASAISLAAASAAALPGGHGAARAVGADAALDGGGVGVAHVEARGGKAERLAEDLGQHRLEPGPHRRGAGVHHEACRRAAPRPASSRTGRGRSSPRRRRARCPRRRPAGRALTAACSARARVVVEPAQQLGEQRGEIAGVVDRVDAERLGAAVVGHLVGADQVAPAQLRRVEAEARRRPGPSGARARSCTPGGRASAACRPASCWSPPTRGRTRSSARGTGRAGARRRTPPAPAPPCARRRRCRRGSPRACRGCARRGRSRSPPRTSTSRAWLAAMRFSRRLSIHFTGRPSFMRGQRHQDVLRVQLAAHAEAAAHVHLGEPQRARRDAEDRRQDRAVDVDALGGADQVQLAAARIGRHRHEPARLQRGGGLPRVAEALAEPTAAPASAASASPTRIVIVATLFESVPANRRGAPGASASATDGAGGQRLVDRRRSAPARRAPRTDRRRRRAPPARPRSARRCARWPAAGSARCRPAPARGWG